MSELRSPFSPGFTDSAADDLADVLAVLASPARLKILAMLRAVGTMTGIEIEQRLKPLRQPTVAHHLRVLTDHGLITARKEGVFVHRKLSGDRLREVSRLLDPKGSW